MKKIVCLLLVVFIFTVICLTGCNSSNENNSPSMQESKAEIGDITEAPTEEPTEEQTEEPLLSDTCDMILAEAFDGDDYYELVCNENEDYEGIKDEMGIIKNNKWLLEISYGNSLLPDTWQLPTKESNRRFSYIGNGCFYYYVEKPSEYPKLYDTMEMFYNAKNNLSYVAKKQSSYSHGVYLFEDSSSEDLLHSVSEDDPYVLLDDHTFYTDGMLTVKILDTNSMKINEVNCDFGDIKFSSDDVCFHPVSEGLFAVSNYFKIIVFFNMQGQVAFDTTEYKLSGNTQTIQFEDGECSIEIKNSAGTPYIVKINKKGEVVDSYPI